MIRNCLHNYIQHTDYYFVSTIDDEDNIRIETNNKELQSLLEDTEFLHRIKMQILTLRHTHLSRGNYQLHFSYHSRQHDAGYERVYTHVLTSFVDYRLCPCERCGKAREDEV